MSRQPRTEPSLPEWAALGLLCEAPAHGWAVAQALDPAGAVGRVYSCTRPLVYRALRQLRESGLVEVRGTATSEAGPARTTLGATRRGRSAFARWRGRAVSHVRDLRSELMLKLLFHDRAGLDPTPLLREQAAVLGRAERSLEQQLGSASGFARTLALWRLSIGRAALSFVDGLLDSRTVEPVVYRPIGYVVSPHKELDGMPLQPIADTKGESTIEVSEAHRGCLSDLDGFSHVWVLAHLHETLGWDPMVPAFLDDRPHGTFATRSPRRPNPVGLSLSRIVEIQPSAVVVEGLDLLDGTPVLDLKPFVPLFDTPSGNLRSGWFEGRADRVFSRTSDDRFALRSRRA
ncbi:MAG: TrmO family methyltransferase [Actinomycetota bacterium]|nr:SAM-dependent methyltransferase [Actinomycetota bacterium]MDQ3086520.1 TrmO family methyltransferase [Actinomycetota bacterium]MDQ3425845.1 TrmO family methyltransferase [Actinomycetota bacterium]